MKQLHGTHPEAAPWGLHRYGAGQGESTQRNITYDLNSHTAIFNMTTTTPASPNGRVGNITRMNRYYCLNITSVPLLKANILARVCRVESTSNGIRYIKIEKFRTEKFR